MPDDTNNLSPEEKIKRVTAELREKNKEVIERRKREGFGIPDSELTDEQIKIKMQKQKEREKFKKEQSHNKYLNQVLKNGGNYSNTRNFNNQPNQPLENLCPHCMHNVSASAYTCPSCGHPLRYSGTRAGAGCLGWTILFIAIPILILIFFLSLAP